jgi:hypothetical protein
MNPTAACLLLLKNPKNAKTKKTKPAPIAQESVAGVLGQRPYKGMNTTLGWCKTTHANANRSAHKNNVMATTFRGLTELVSLNVRCVIMWPKTICPQFLWQFSVS